MDCETSPTFHHSFKLLSRGVRPKKLEFLALKSPRSSVLRGPKSKRLLPTEPANFRFSTRLTWTEMNWAALPDFPLLIGQNGSNYDSETGCDAPKNVSLRVFYTWWCNDTVWPLRTLASESGAPTFSTTFSSGFHDGITAESLSSGQLFPSIQRKHSRCLLHHFTHISPHQKNSYGRNWYLWSLELRVKMRVWVVFDCTTWVCLGALSSFNLANKLILCSQTSFRFRSPNHICHYVRLRFWSVSMFDCVVLPEKHTGFEYFTHRAASTKSWNRPCGIRWVG